MAKIVLKKTLHTCKRLQIRIYQIKKTSQESLMGGASLTKAPLYILTPPPHRFFQQQNHLISDYPTQILLLSDFALPMNNSIRQLEAERKNLGFLYGNQQASAPQEMAAASRLLSPNFISPHHPNPFHRSPVPPDAQNQASDSRLRRIEAASRAHESQFKNPEVSLFDLWLAWRL